MKTSELEAILADFDALRRRVTAAEAPPQLSPPSRLLELALTDPPGLRAALATVAGRTAWSGELCELANKLAASRFELCERYRRQSSELRGADESLKLANESIKLLQDLSVSALSQKLELAIKALHDRRWIEERIAALTAETSAEPKAGRSFTWAMGELRAARSVRRAHWQAEPESPAELYASVSSTGRACIRFRRKDGTSGSTDDFLYPLNSFLAARFFGDIFADDWQSA